MRDGRVARVAREDRRHLDSVKAGFPIALGFICSLNYIHLDRGTFSSQKRQIKVDKNPPHRSTFDTRAKPPIFQKRMQIRVTTTRCSKYKARRGPATKG